MVPVPRFVRDLAHKGAPEKRRPIRPAPLRTAHLLALCIELPTARDADECPYGRFSAYFRVSRVPVPYEGHALAVRHSSHPRRTPTPDPRAARGLRHRSGPGQAGRQGGGPRQRDGVVRLRCLQLHRGDAGQGLLPLRQPHSAVAVHLRRLRRGLPRPPARRHGLRPARRPRRPPEGPRPHHDHDGGGHLRDRPDPLVRHDRRRRSPAAARGPGSSRASPPAASTRAPPPSSPSTRPTRSAASSGAGWNSARSPDTSAAPAWSPS